MPRAEQSRAEQSQAAYNYNAGTIANTSDDIDYSIGRFKVSVSSRLAWISHGRETFWTQEELCPPITLIKSIAIGMA
eukprot:scaffold2800_cov93-Skeletonema_marinoi.AAC.1